MANCGTVTVVDVSSSVSIVDCTTSPSQVQPDQDVTAEVTLENTSGSQISVDLQVTANGQSVFSGPVNVPSNGSDTVSVTFLPNSVGVSGNDSFDVVSSIESASFAAPASAPRRRARAPRTDGGYLSNGGCGCGR